MTGAGVSAGWRCDMVFKNRSEAGRALATAVETIMARPFIVAALPRGGVEVALPVAERLAVPLAVSYARKLTAPLHSDMCGCGIRESQNRTAPATGVAPSGRPAAPACDLSRLGRPVGGRSTL